MNKRNKVFGLTALLGLAGGAFAYWKYRNMTPTEKAKIKSKFDETGRKIKGAVGDVEETLSEKYEKLKDLTKKNKVNETAI